MTKTLVRTPILGTGARTAGQSPAGSGATDVGGKAYSVLLALGLVLATVGWFDILLNLVPPAIGNPEWEIGTVSLTIDALPLGTLGVGLAVVGAALGGRGTALKILGVIALGGAIFILATALLYALALPVVWTSVVEPMRNPFLLATVKTMVLGTIYLVFYSWLGVKAVKFGNSLRSAAP